MPSPSTSLITNMNSVIATGPSVNTAKKAIDPGGEIMDYVAMLQSVLLNLQEAKNKLQGITGSGGIIGDTDAGDPNLSTLQNVLASLS